MNDPLMSLRERRMQRLRLRDLRLLDAIDRHGTLAGVSRELFVSQPAASQALGALESALGTRLAERSSRGVTLTDAGRVLRAHLDAADASLAAGLAALDAPSPLPLLRLGTIPYGLLEALPLALARLGDAPFTVRVVTAAVEPLHDALRRGDVDAILARPASTVRRRGRTEPPRPDLATVPVTRLRTAIAGAGDHPMARRRRPPTVAELAGAAWVLPDATTTMRASFDDLFVRAGLAPPRPRIECGGFADNLRIAAAAGLLTVAPVDAIATARPTMRTLLAPPEWSAPVVLACLRHRAAWPPIAALAAALGSLDLL